MNQETPIKLNIHQLLKREGDVLGHRFTLQHLSAKTGIDYASLIDHAHGRTKRVDYTTLSRLKHAFGCSWDELIGLRDSEPV